jgi:hypothetical protein
MLMWTLRASMEGIGDGVDVDVDVDGNKIRSEC